MFIEENIRYKIIATLGILVLSVFAGLFIRMSLREPRSKSEQTATPNKLPKEASTFKKSIPGFSPIISGLEELNVPALPIPKPSLKIISEKNSLPDTAAPFFENINQAVKAVEKSLTPDNAPAQKISTVTSAGIILSLTKDQFHFLYPDSFITDLISAQNLFIKEYDPAYEPIYKIETDAQVRLIEEKIVAASLSANMITKDRAEQLVTTIRFTLPELQLIDLKKYNSYGFYEFLPPLAAPKRLFLTELMEKLAEALAHKAQAVICGTCVSLPLCFQEGAATPGVTGSELLYIFCYCTGCLTSLGCLSANSGVAAIYDQTTGICGVGL